MSITVKVEPSLTLTRLVVDQRPTQGPQALCRASVRGCKNGVCDPCDAYLIASARSGILKALPNIFPDCLLKPWQPVEKPLRGRPKQAADFVIDWFDRNPAGLLRFNVAQKALGIAAASNFTQNVRQHPDFINAIKGHGIIEADGRRGFLKLGF